jgi:hypothetical protein
MDILAALASSRSLKLTLVLGDGRYLAGCGKQDEAGAHGGGPPAVSVAPAVKRDVQEFDEFTARLEAPDTVDIRSRVAGTLVQVHFREGQTGQEGRSAVHHRSAAVRGRGGARRGAAGGRPHLRRVEQERTGARREAGGDPRRQPAGNRPVEGGAGERQFQHQGVRSGAGASPAQSGIHPHHGAGQRPHFARQCHGRQPGQRRRSDPDHGGVQRPHLRVFRRQRSDLPEIHACRARRHPAVVAR